MGSVKKGEFFKHKDLTPCPRDGDNRSSFWVRRKARKIIPKIIPKGDLLLGEVPLHLIRRIIKVHSCVLPYRDEKDPFVFMGSRRAI